MRSILGRKEVWMEGNFLILDCSLQKYNINVLFCFLRNIFSICKSVIRQYFVMVGPENLLYSPIKIRIMRKKVGWEKKVF